MRSAYPKKKQESVEYQSSYKRSYIALKPKSSPSQPIHRQKNASLNTMPYHSAAQHQTSQRSQSNSVRTSIPCPHTTPKASPLHNHTLVVLRVTRVHPYSTLSVLAAFVGRELLGLLLGDDSCLLFTGAGGGLAGRTCRYD